MILALLLTPLMSASAAAKQPYITSAYTKFDERRCKEIEAEHDIEGGELWSVSRCPGYHGIPLFLSYDDERDDLDAGVRNQASAFEGPMHHVNQTVEWRLSDGKPFAIIFRIAASPPHARWARLIVETIGRPGKPGCPVAKFDALKLNANVAARRAADAVLNGKAHCIDLGE